MKARRYNKGTVSNLALKELAKTYTLGAHKYSIYKDKEGKEILGIDIPLEEATKNLYN